MVRSPGRGWLAQLPDMVASTLTKLCGECGLGAQRKTQYNARRHCAVQWGPDVTRRFLKRNGLALVVRSHECVARGLQVRHAFVGVWQ